MERDFANAEKDRKMSSTAGLRFLRPRTQNDLSTARKAAYLRFFSTSQSLLGKKEKKSYKKGIELPAPTSGLEVRAKVQERINELKAANALNWPRIKSSKDAMTIGEYLDNYGMMLPTDNLEKSKEYVVVRGRARSLRIAGKALVFVDIAQDGKSVQIMLNRSNLGSLGVATRSKFEEFYHVIRRGDIICKSYITIEMISADCCSRLWKSSLQQFRRVICKCCRTPRDFKSDFGKSSTRVG